MRATSRPLPSGGDIKALGVISFNTPTTTSADEFLVIFKERELWIITGSSSSDWALKFIDYVGCPAQSLMVYANGFLFWIDYRGVYLWDGSNKPVYCSRPIENDFSGDGDLDLTSLPLGSGTFYRKQNQVIWALSSTEFGTQKLLLKLDLRLTLPSVQDNLFGRTLEGVFIKDKLTYNAYSLFSAIMSSSELLYSGGNEGRLWTLFSNENTKDDDTAAGFKYRTRPEDFGLIGQVKRIHKVIVWCRESTTQDLTLNYWLQYRINDTYQETQSKPITEQVSNGIWDQASWDSAYWDQKAYTYKPVVFELGNDTIGTEGDAITLEFVQSDSNAPLTIVGYTVIFSLLGTRK